MDDEALAVIAIADCHGVGEVESGYLTGQMVGEQGGRRWYVQLSFGWRLGHGEWRRAERVSVSFLDSGWLAFVYMCKRGGGEAAKPTSPSELESEVTNRRCLSCHALSQW